MTKENETPKKANWMSSSLLIAALPAFSYAIAFAFEAGLAKYYGISSQLIEITLPGTISALGYLFGTIFALWMIAELLNPFWGKLPPVLRKRVALYGGLLLATIGYVLVAGEKFSNMRFLWAIFSIMLFFDFILPALAFWDKRSYLDRIQQIHSRDLSYDSILDKLASRVGVSWIVIGMVVLFALSFSYYTGVGKARRQVEYLVLVGDDSIVLRQYGDTIVSARMDRTKKLISRIYTVRKISAENPISFSLENVGPLTLGPSEEAARTRPAENSKSIDVPNKKLKRDAATSRRAP